MGVSSPAAVTDGVRVRVAVLALFASCGLTVGSWASRVPAVLAHVGVAAERWGFLALCTAVGTVAALTRARRWHRRFGPRRVLAVALPGMLFLPPVVAAAPSPTLLAAGLFAHGVATGAAQHPMNVSGLAAERLSGRPMLAGFHGGFSLGLLAGGLVGAAAAAAGVGPVAQHGAVAVLLAAFLAVSRRWLPPAPAPAPPAEPVRATARRAWNGRIAVLTLVAFLTLLCEGAMNQWTAVFVGTTRGLGDAAGALAFASFALAMAAGRLAGDRVTARLGRVAVVRLGALLAAAGAAGFLLLPGLGPVCLAAGAVGAGLSCLMPLTLALAGREAGGGDAVATVLLASWPALVVGPPVIAGLATAVGLRPALAVVAVLATAIAVLASLLGPPAGRLRPPA